MKPMSILSRHPGLEPGSAFSSVTEKAGRPRIESGVTVRA
jgi:hypothetical protein